MKIWCVQPENIAENFTQELATLFLIHSYSTYPAGTVPTKFREIASFRFPRYSAARVDIHRTNFAVFILDLRISYSQSRLYIGFTVYPQIQSCEICIIHFWREIG
jgi:hypothetical protein